MLRFSDLNMSTSPSKFSVENFDPAPDEELVCSICRCVFDEPMECPCRHIFCRGCITNWLERKSSCPICRKRVYILDLQQVVPLIKNMIAKLSLVCPNHENGCKQKTNLDSYNNHVTCCLYEMMACKNKNCPQSVLRKDVLRHEDEDCEFRLLMCQRECNLMLPSTKIKHHNCIKELKKHLEESLNREESLNKHIEEITNELNTYKKQSADARINPFQFNSVLQSAVFNSDDSSSSFIDSFDSIFTSDSDDYNNDVYDSPPTLLRSLRSRLSRLDTLMSSIAFPSPGNDTTTARQEVDASTNNEEPRRPADVTLEIVSDIENNNSTQSVANSTGPFNFLNEEEFSPRTASFNFLNSIDDTVDTTANTSLNVSADKSSDVEEEFPTAAQCRILKRKRPASVISVSSDSDHSDSGARTRRVRSTAQHETTVNSLSDTSSEIGSNYHARSRRRTQNRERSRFPRSLVPVVIPDTSLTSSVNSPQSSPSTSPLRMSGLEHTRELLELFSVETDPDWEPSMEEAVSEGEELPDIRPVPAATLLDSMLGDENSDQDSEELSDSDLSERSYEVLVPERTYDLLYRYAQEESEEDEDWTP